MIGHSTYSDGILVMDTYACIMVVCAIFSYCKYRGNLNVVGKSFLCCPDKGHNRYLIFFFSDYE